MIRLQSSLISMLLLFVVVTMSGTALAASLEDRVKALEENSSSEEKNAPVTSKQSGVDFKFGGELEFEYVDADKDSKNPHGNFQLDTFYLYPDVAIGDDWQLYGEIAIKSSDTIAEEVWAKYTCPKTSMWIEFGVNDYRNARLDRISEAEILIETAFYRNDASGIFLGGDFGGGTYWGASVTNTQTLEGKQPGEDDSHQLLSDGRNINGTDATHMYGLVLGYKGDIGDVNFDIMPFMYDGKLSEGDMGTLEGIEGYGDLDDKAALSSNDDKTRAGLNLHLSSGPFDLLCQYLTSEDGDLERTGWFLQPAFELNDTFQFMYRYSNLDVDVDNAMSDSYTWDRQQHVFSAVQSVSHTIKMKYEYFINDEDTGSSDVDNDELLVQIEVHF